MLLKHKFGNQIYALQLMLDFLNISVWHKYYFSQHIKVALGNFNWFDFGKMANADSPSSNLN